MDYTLTFFGKKVAVSPAVFWPAFAAITAFALFLVWCTLGGVYKFGGLAAVFAYVILFGEIVINGVRKSLLPVTINRVLSVPITIAAVVYYWM